MSVICVVQNISPGKKGETSVETPITFLFKSPGDKHQIPILARQLNPREIQEFMKSYEEATSRHYGYLLLDLKPTTDDRQRLKTNVLLGEGLQGDTADMVTKYMKKIISSTSGA